MIKTIQANGVKKIWNYMYNKRHQLLFPFVWLIKKSKALSAVSMRFTKLTGKSKYRIHPKHLIKIEKPWYLHYINTSDVVLDLGCNNGHHSLRIAKKCKKMVGLDYDENQLKIARHLAKDKKIKNIEFKFHDLEKKIKIKDKSFDKVICLDVLEHIVKRDQLLKEIKRVLKPKGLTFIAVPNVETSWKELQKKVGIKNIYADPDHKVEYSEARERKIFKAVGLKIISLKPIVYDTPFIGIFDMIGGLSLKMYAKIGLWKKKRVENNIKESTGFRIVAKKSKSL